MPGYPLNPSGNRTTPAGWTGTVTNPSAPAGGNGPGTSQPYSRQEPDEGSWFWGAVHGAEHFADSAYHSAVGLVHDAEDTAIRVAHVAQAIYLADDYAGDAIRDKIGMDIAELKKAFIPGLVMSLGILAITTLAGATVAGILVGALTAGVGAVPAAVAGGELGLDAGFLILDALGIGFLLREVFGGISEVFDLVKSSMAIAWNAGSNPRVPPMTGIDKAAHGLAIAVAEMVNLLLQGVLIWILKESAVARAGKLAKGSGSLTDPGALAARGTQVLRDLSAKPAELRATLKEGASELAGILRKAGQLTRGLADFVETKFEQILKKVTEAAGNKAEELKGKGAGGGDPSVAPWKGPVDYSALKNPRGAGPGKAVTTSQKQKMYDLNRQQNGGVLRDDATGEELVQPQKSASGVTPPANEAQIDHIQPVSKGGTNAYDNLQVRSRAANRAKSDTWDGTGDSPTDGDGDPSPDD